MFTNLHLKKKFALLAGSIFFGFVVLILNLIISESTIEHHIQIKMEDVLRDEASLKIKLSTDALASALGEYVEGKNEKEQIAIIQDAIERFRFEDDKSGYFYAYKKYVPVAHPVRKDLIGTSLYDTKDMNGVYYVRELYETSLKGEHNDVVHYIFSKPLPDGTSINENKIAYAVHIPNTEDIWLSTGIYENTFVPYSHKVSAHLLETTEYEIYKSIAISILLCSIIALPFFIMFYKNITTSVTKLEEYAISFFKFINHETDDVIQNPLKNKDEFGDLAKQLENNIQNTKEGIEKDKIAITTAGQTVKDIEDGNLHIRINVDPYNPRLKDLADVLNLMLDAFEKNVGSDLNKILKVLNSYNQLNFLDEIENPKGQIEVMTNNLGHEMRSMLASSKSFADSLSHSTNRLEESMQVLLESSSNQADSIQSSVASIEQISQSMQEVDQKTTDVTKYANNIKDVAVVIKSIAEQTDLLALNAAIEAARAGEHGRGFAVVADEVRQLSTRTGQSLTQIEENVRILVEGMTDIEGSIHEQSKGIAQINDTVNVLDEIVKKNVDVAHQTNSISKDVQQIANDILEEVSLKQF